MSSRIKIYVVTVFVAFLFLVSSGSAHSREIWVKGTVTKAPWTGQYQHVEVDHSKYTFMPKVLEVRLPQHSGNTGFKRESDALRSIREGQTVWLKVQGRRIYEILVEK